MKIWEIIKICMDGGYIAGDSFINQLGEVIYFNGQLIKGLEDINPHDEWEYNGVMTRIY